jgi:membrane protease YdiL (CAAX protease family)
MRVSRPSSDPGARAAIAGFLLLTFVLAWIPAWLVRPLWQAGTGPLVTRLLAASVLYGATMGWQPLVAALVVRRWLASGGGDLGVRSTAPRFAALALGLPIAVMVASATIDWLAARTFGMTAGPVFASAEPEIGRAAPSIGVAAVLVLAFILTIAVLYLQCFSEEYGWRGFFLTTLMRVLGPRRGLVVHGVIWGLWYAPAFLLATNEIHRNALRCTAFIFTCTLLGVLLGWLRLASKSILPAVMANGLLTLICGLPFILQNVEVGARGAAYSPIGWLPLAGIGVALIFGKWRSAIAVPARPEGAASITVLVRWPTGRADQNRPN